MNVILCLDDRGGMMFNHRRQSRDREVIKDIFNMIGDRPLFLNSYSAPLFSEKEDQLRIDEKFLDTVGEDEWCFVENRALLPYANHIETMVLYRWNRTYPFDMKMDIDPAFMGLVLCETVDFVGFSHEKITKEVYKR